jgi:hypothetical protein
MTGTRQYPRFSIELDVEVRRDGRVVRGRSANLSQSGIALAVPEAVPVATPVGLTIALVRDGRPFSEPLALPATIVWCTRMGDRYQLGAKFEELTPVLASFLALFTQYLE